MRLRGRHVVSGQLLDLVCAGGQLTSVGPATTEAADHTAAWVAPALFDLQINGCCGRAFSSERFTVEDVGVVVNVMHRHGVAGFCPTLVTNAFAVLKHGFQTLARACDADPAWARCLPAFHLEGPYLSPEDGPRGAHARAFIRPPSLDEFRRLQEAAGGRIRLVTLAPETPGALAFIEALVTQGIVVAIGHTAASPGQIRAAVRAGARLSTHLGNGAHALLPRHENYLWEQLDAGELWASVIADGHHLPPAVLRCILRLKTPARTILTCDASSLAGLPPGRYQEWGQEYEVLAGGKVVVPGTPFLAGSGLFTDTCVGHAVAVGGVNLADALAMAGARPRTLLRLPELSLEAGQPADVILFDSQPDDPFRIVTTVVGGRVYAADPASGAC
jgi:N-acetylglucosamine-6-phosphate deacetylase